MALKIVSEKTRLVSVTTFLDTISNVVLATSIGLVLSGYFGPIGWLYSAVLGSLVIMTFLYLLPKAIGIENALRMSLALAPATQVAMTVLSPVAVPLTSLARSISTGLVGRAGYKEVDLVEEFEDVVGMLEKAGHIEPDAGRLLRSALGSSRSLAGDILTPVKDIVSIPIETTIIDAIGIMGKANHPRVPVYDQRKGTYVGAVTFVTMSKAISRGLAAEGVQDYMIQPAKASREDSLATVMEKLQDAGTTIAFVFDGENMVGMITLSDIIEQVLGIKV